MTAEQKAATAATSSTAAKPTPEQGNRMDNLPCMRIY